VADAPRQIDVFACPKTHDSEEEVAMFVRESTPVIDLIAGLPYAEDALQWYGVSLDDEARELTVAQVAERDGADIDKVLGALRDLTGALTPEPDELDYANEPEGWDDEDLYEEAM
jgi:hypothetical protein